MNSIPNHVAIIMDGNGRWAERKNLRRSAGHVVGERVFKEICIEADSIGIKVLTVFAFSTENWNRSEEEVAKIMHILQNYFSSCNDLILHNNFKIKVIGDRSLLSSNLKTTIEKVEEASYNNTGLLVQIAINYGGKDEIVRAVNKLLDDHIISISEEDIDKSLDTYDTPFPDLMIRTGGEMRISNFMIWQLAYSEFYFTDTLWPDFNKDEFNKAIRYYQERDRRFGAIK